MGAQGSRRPDSSLAPDTEGLASDPVVLPSSFGGWSTEILGDVYNVGILIHTLTTVVYRNQGRKAFLARVCPEMYVSTCPGPRCCCRGWGLTLAAAASPPASSSGALAFPLWHLLQPKKCPHLP